LQGFTLQIKHRLTQRGKKMRSTKLCIGSAPAAPANNSAVNEEEQPGSRSAIPRSQLSLVRNIFAAPNQKQAEQINPASAGEPGSPSLRHC
jgi:hypothetical protein